MRNGTDDIITLNGQFMSENVKMKTEWPISLRMCFNRRSADDISQIASSAIIMLLIKSLCLLN